MQFLDADGVAGWEEARAVDDAGGEVGGGLAQREGEWRPGGVGSEGGEEARGARVGFGARKGFFRGLRFSDIVWCRREGVEGEDLRVGDGQDVGPGVGNSADFSITRPRVFVNGDDFLLPVECPDAPSAIHKPHCNAQPIHGMLLINA